MTERNILLLTLGVRRFFWKVLFFELLFWLWEGVAIGNMIFFKTFERYWRIWKGSGIYVSW